MTFICLLIFCKGGGVCFRQRVEKRRNKMLMKLLTGKKCKKSKKKQNKTKTVERIVSLSCKITIRRNVCQNFLNVAFWNFLRSHHIDVANRNCRKPNLLQINKNNSKKSQQINICLLCPQTDNISIRRSCSSG